MLYFAISDAINDAINISVLNRLANEIRVIQSKNGLPLKNIMEIFDIKRATGQRDMKMLKEAGYVDFSGSNKNGKYVLTERGKCLFMN